MATRYVRKTGSNSNNGSTPALAWLTITKALGASGLASGDVCYVGAGTYREGATVAMTSAVAETKLIADVDGSQTGDMGEVIWTGFLTNDTTAPTSSANLDLAGRDFLTFEGFTFYGGGATGVINGSTATSTNIIWRRCVFITNSLLANQITMTNAADVVAHWLFDQCVLMSTMNRAAFLASVVNGATSDYDVDVLFNNCMFYIGGGGFGIDVSASGAGTGKVGGVKATNCTFFGGANAMRTASTSTTVVCRVDNSLLIHQSGGISAGASGQILEDNNRIISNSPRTNVTAGTSSVSDNSQALMVEIGQSSFRLAAPRIPFTPTVGSPLLGRGASAAGQTLSVDMANRVRPSGGASLSKGWGALERHDIAAKETTTTDAGGVGIVITGPGDHDIQIPVDTTSTSITIRARYDTTHDVTTKPQVILQANGEIGVTTQTITMTSAADTWETLTIASFTPIARGIVTIRLVSRPAAGGGKAFFDTITVS